MKKSEAVYKQAELMNEYEDMTKDNFYASDPDGFMFAIDLADRALKLINKLINDGVQHD